MPTFAPASKDALTTIEPRGTRGRVVTVVNTLREVVEMNELISKYVARLEYK